MSGDRGYSVRKTFMHNTERGIASVFPWRQGPGESARRDMDRDEVDRHGIIRCRECGGPCDSDSAGLGFLLLTRLDANGVSQPKPVSARAAS